MENKFLCTCIFLLLLTNLFFAIVFLKHVADYDQKPDFSRKAPPLSLLSPRIAKVDEKSFSVLQDKFIPSYQPLRDKMIKSLKSADGVYGVYFEDLYSGTWTGVSEREAFTPASLLKAPLAAAVLKSKDESEIDLAVNVTITKDDLDNNFGHLFFHGENATYSIKDLLEIMIKDSDNTAANALRKLVTDERLIESRLALGLPLTSVTQASDEAVRISPKQFSHLFRSLYFSTYTGREDSEYILKLLARTSFDTLLKAGVPPETIVAHKYGQWQKESSVHDCGIVYHPKRDYILCVMSKKASNQEAQRVISSISKMVYDYVSEN